MYRKPRFLEELHAIREEMSRECDYDIDLFVEMVRSGKRPGYHLADRPPSGKSNANDEHSHKSATDD